MSYEPVVGIRSRLCNKRDTNCDEPVSGYVSSDENGTLNFEVRRTFDGYLEMTDQNFGTSLHFFHPAIVREQDFGTTVLVSIANATALAAQTGVSFSSDRGLLLLRSLACDGTPAAGIHFAMDDLDAMRRPYYSIDGLPSTAAKETDRDGYGGFVNVAPGIAAVRVYGNVEDDAVRSNVSLLVRPGAVTYGRISLTLPR